MKYVGAEPVSRLAMAVKPRYHFAGKHHRFYERTPYRLGMCIISSCLPTHESLGMRLVYHEHKMYVRLWVCVSLVSQEPSSVAGRTATCDQVHISCSSWKSRQEEQGRPLTLFQEPFIFCTCKVVY